DLETGDRDLVSLAETDAHLLLERFGARVDVELVVSALDDQFRELFPGSPSQLIYFIHYALGFRLGLKVILRQAVVGWLSLLRESRDRTQEQKQGDAGKYFDSLGSLDGRLPTE